MRARTWAPCWSSSGVSRTPSASTRRRSSWPRRTWRPTSDSTWRWPTISRSRFRPRPLSCETLYAAQPRNLNLALLLADCRLRMGEFQEAVNVAAPLEAEHPDEPALNYVLGMALIRSGRVAEGQIRVDRILRRGDSAEGHFLLGSALFAAGELSRRGEGTGPGRRHEPRASLAPVVPGAGAAVHRRCRWRRPGLPQGTGRQPQRFRRQFPACLHPGPPRAGQGIARTAGARRAGAPRFERSRRRFGQRLPFRPGRRGRSRRPGRHGGSARSDRSPSPAWPARRAGVRQLHLPETAEFGRRPEAHRRAIPSAGGLPPGLHQRSARRRRRGIRNGRAPSIKRKESTCRPRTIWPKSRSMPPSACAGWDFPSPSPWMAWMRPPSARTRPGPAVFI